MPFLARLTHTDDLVSMGEIPTLQRPLAATFIKLKITGSPAGVIDISYHEIANHIIVPPASIETVVNGVLDGSIALVWRPPNMTLPSRSRLTLRNNAPGYFVFLLDIGNYRFSTDDYPFRIEGGKADYFYEARCVWLDNGTYHHGRKPPANVSARAGYFIAYSDLDLLHTGNQQFTSKFNLYLDLDYAGSAPVPITVDPDVGYPGGNS